MSLLIRNPRLLMNQTIRNLHELDVTKLYYTEYGEPAKVIQKLDEKIEYNLEPSEVLIKMLAAPVNPQDVNIIEGKYPIRPPLPSVPGNEGVGEIIDVGKAVQNVFVGDWVVPVNCALGTWRSYVRSSAGNVFKVPKNLGLVEAATLTVNPCTAYRMLKDFVPLVPGDTVIQNGANSACGQNVIQLARVMCLKTVNVVRDRVRIDDLKVYLKELGGTYVLTEEELRTTNIFKNNAVRKPRLALNCVGGKSCLELNRYLDKNSCLVTYGGMGRQPATIPTGSLIFKKLKAVGFWLNEWLSENKDSVQRQNMFEDIISLMTSGELKGPAHSIVPFNHYKEALSNTLSLKGMIGKKFILKFN